MSEPTSRPVAETTAELVYRPISGLAVSGLLLASLYAGLVVISATVALVQGAAFFLPMWLGVIALAGGILSFLAQRQIRDSEGTRAGMAIARWGLWLSIFSGLGYGAYYYFTGLALIQQANHFLMVKEDDDSGFFPRLLEAKDNPVELNRAFLLTLSFSRRGGSNPAKDEDMERQYNQSTPMGGKGELSRFRDDNLVQALVRDGRKVQVEPLGVQEWSYEKSAEKHGYTVTRNYRITTPEVIVEVLLTVQSTEGSAEGERRRWFVMWNYRRQSAVQLTDWGQSLKNMRNDLRFRFLDRWLFDASVRKEGDDFAKIDRTDWASILPRKAHQEYVREYVTEMFRGTGGRLTSLNIPKSPTDELANWTPWEQVDGRMRFYVPFTYFVPPQAGFPGFNLDGQFLIISKGPVDPDNFQAFPEWTLEGITIVRAAPVTK